MVADRGCRGVGEHRRLAAVSVVAARPCLLAERTWPQIAGLVEAGEELCLLPVGATEQHGPHLPVSTDTEIAEAVCLEASRRTGVPLLPTLWLASSQAHTAKWPGTFSLSPRLLVDVVVELAGWVRAAGFGKLLILNGHVGNLGPLRVAVDEIRARSHLRVGLAHWYELTPAIAADVTADADGWHAHAAETALMLHLRPELVHRAQIRDDPDRTEGLVFSYTVPETSVEGLTGAPSTATAEQGAALFEAVVGALVERVEAGRTEKPPLSEQD
jgi:creatinine amidohydrolase